MYIRFVSLGARTIIRAFERVIALLAHSVHSKHAIIAHYSAHRWCDSTERALNKELMGRGCWLGNCFETHK
jgi:hypothetical protein